MYIHLFPDFLPWVVPLPYMIIMNIAHAFIHTLTTLASHQHVIDLKDFHDMLPRSLVWKKYWLYNSSIINNVLIIKMQRFTVIIYYENICK